MPARRGSKTAARCPPCKREHDRRHNARRPERRSHAEQQRRRQAVQAHVQAYGWRCLGLPGYDHPTNPTRDLTAHHAQAIGAGGTMG